ncbi:MAG: tol-pal system YbgF family protein [Gammaproteobacteria bacterium]
MAYLSQATTPQAMQQGRLWLTSLLPYAGQYQRTLGLLDTRIEEAFTHGDTATAVESLVIKGVMSAAGQRNSVRSNAALDRVLVFRDRTDVPNLRQALAYLAALSNRSALAFELLSTHDRFNPPIVLSIAGQCDQAASMFETVKEIHGAPAFLQLFSFYHLAECRFDEGNLISAEPYAEAALQIYNPLDFFARGVYYPKTLFLLGKVSEAKGDAEAAMQYYQQLLDLWKNADDDLPDLLEAKRRFAQLKETTVR